VSSGDSQDKNKKISIGLMDFYHKAQIIEEMRINFNTECEKVGYALFCYPCPKHPGNKYDRLIFNKFGPTRDFYWACALSPLEYTDSFVSLTDEEIEEMNEIKVAKPEIAKTRIEIIARHILSNNHIISVKNGEKVALFVYNEKKGKYELKGKPVMEVEIQGVHTRVFGDEPMSITTANNVYNSIAEYANRGTDMTIFDNDDGTIYYIPFLDKDIEVNRKTGKMKILEKDPENRPFLSAMPYSLGGVEVDEMPAELKDVLELVAPSHRDDLLMELASPLAFQGSRRIFLNFSRVGATGKTTLLRRIGELYPDLVFWGEPGTLSERFEKSALLGKSALLLDEYEGSGYSIRRELKNLASSNSLRVEVKHGPILSMKNRLSIIINSNNLEFDWKDDALLSRLTVIPFIRNFSGNCVVEPWDDDVKKRVIIYLMKNVLPRYFTSTPRTYSLQAMKKWCENSSRGIKPDDGVEDFLRQRVYRHLEKSGLILAPQEVYRYYLVFASQNEVIPLSEKEFLERVEYLARRDKGWVVEGKMSLQTKGLFNFM